MKHTLLPHMYLCEAKAAKRHLEAKVSVAFKAACNVISGQYCDCDGF